MPLSAGISVPYMCQPASILAEKVILPVFSPVISIELTQVTGLMICAEAEKMPISIESKRNDNFLVIII